MPISGSNAENPIARNAMTPAQIGIVALCVCLNALDGFEVLAISFAAPGIAEQWGIDRAALGVVLSMELIGMAIGSVLLGSLADQRGRKPVIIVCLLLMALGMVAASVAGGVVHLSLARLITGLGIGGMLATTNAVVSEFASERNRSMVVSWMATGYPLGVVVGGSIVSVLLVYFDWRSVFVFGALLSLAFLPWVIFGLPESVGYLSRQSSPNALHKVNAVLKKIGHKPVASLEYWAKHERSSGLRELFAPSVVRTTILLTLAYFTHIITFYFILKWVPKIVVDLGYSASSAGGVLVWANIGGIAGSLLLSFLTRKFYLRALVLATLAGSAISVTVFGLLATNLATLTVGAACVGFFTNSAVVGMYAMFAQRFPERIRASGTGFVIGFGRGGAALGPIFAGYLFATGQPLEIVSAFMALGALVAAAALLGLSSTQKNLADN